MRRIRQSLSVASLDPIAPLVDGFSDKVTTTPLVVQDAFGYGGVRLPADGLNYCGPTAATMPLLWLGKNGWSQIGPPAPKREDALRLDRILGGLAATSALGGTYLPYLQGGVGDYLNAKGIPSTAFSWISGNGPTVAFIASLNSQQTVVTLLIGWYTPNGGAYVRTGGHFVAILGQDPQTNTLIIGNPCPSTLAMVPDEPRYARQKLTTSTFNGSSPDLPEQGIPYLQFPDMTWLGSSQAVTPVLETVIALTVDTSQRSGAAPSPWTLGAQQAIDTNGADFTVLAPLAGAGGLAQTGAGDLVLEGANTTSGSNAISGGSLGGPGSTTLSGAVAIGGGGLVLDPGGAGSQANVALPGGVSFSGAAELVLVAGQNDSLAVTLGAQGGSQGLTWIDPGTLTIIVDRGLAELGQACTLTAPGGIGTLLQSPIVSPSIVAKSRGAADGDFLTYGSAGFGLPAYTSSKSTNINSASASDVYLVDSDQILNAGADVTVCALNVGQYALSAAGPNAVLNVSPQAAGGQAGLILNTATLSGFQLNLGAANAAIYMSGTSQVGAVIAGSGQLTVFGPGALSLVAANVYTGETLVQSGTLEVSAGSGTGSGPVLVQGTGSLAVAGIISGEIQAEQGGTIVLAGGTAAGGISVDDQSTLSGYGSVQSDATVSGQIVAGSSPGMITFQDAATLRPNPIFIWTLFSLVDNSTTGASFQWNSLTFADAAGSTIGSSSDGAYVLLDMTRLGREYGPNSGNAFWLSSHTWTLFEGNAEFGWVNVWLLQPQFASGYFSISYNSGYSTVFLNFTPSALQA
jgi:autotransporter-associated beta strand protein